MYTLSQIRSGLERKVDTRPLTGGQKGAIIGVLNRICLSDKARHVVLAWCFPETFSGKSVDQVTSKDLDERQWYALYRWVNYYKTETDEYAYHAGLEEECAEILLTQMPLMGEMVIRPIESDSLFVPA